MLQWDGQPLGNNHQRFENLQTVVREHNDTPFVDDAALLLARARFLYHGDAQGAIEGLHQVAEDYPDGQWLLGDFQFHNLFATGPVRPDREGVVRVHGHRARTPGEKDRKSATLTYLEYLHENPNSTADAAHYWSAWIIVNSAMEARYPEAEQILRGLIDGHKEAARTQGDLAAAEQLGDNGLWISRTLERPERKAHQLLIELLSRTGREADAVREAREYARLHDGHRSVEVIERRVRRLTQ